MLAQILERLTVATSYGPTNRDRIDRWVEYYVWYVDYRTRTPTPDDAERFFNLRRDLQDR